MRSHLCFFSRIALTSWVVLDAAAAFSQEATGGATPEQAPAPATDCAAGDAAALSDVALAECLATLEKEITTREQYQKIAGASEERKSVAEALAKQRTRLGLLKAEAYDRGKKAQAKETAEAESRAETEKAEKSKEEGVELLNGQLRFGITTTLFRLQATRPPDQPGRNRQYQLALDRLPLDLGFQFAFRPMDFPYRLGTQDGNGFQLVSLGGMLSVGVNHDRPSQSNVMIGLIASFFEESVSLGIGFDVYRGIPIADNRGAAGQGTLPTGLAGWALSRKGQITAENFALLLTINLTTVARQVGDKK